MKRLFLAMGLLFCASAANATNWFVRSATTCANNGDGTSAACAGSPGGVGGWRGLSSIVWGSVHAGDTLFLVSGDTYTGQLTIGSSGTLGNVVRVSVSGGGTSIIDTQGSSSGINFNGQAYVTVDGIIGNAAFGGSTTYGIRVINLGVDKYCSYMNNGEHDVKALHIECLGTGITGTTDYTGGFYAGSLGTQGSSAILEIGYNWVHGPAPTSGGTTICYPNHVNTQKQYCATGIKSFPPLNGTTFTNTLIHDNFIQYLFEDGIDVGNNASIYHNEVSGVSGSGHSDSIQCQSAQYCALYSNYVHGSNDQNCYLDNAAPGSTNGHIRVYNNVLDSPNGFGGCNVDAEGDGSGNATWNDIVIANNTFLNSGGYNISSGRGTVTNLTVLNNIFGVTNLCCGNSFVPVYTGSIASYTSSTSWDYDTYATTSLNYPTIAHVFGGDYTLTGLHGLSPARETNGNNCNVGFIGGAFPNNATPVTGDACAKNKGLNLFATLTYLQTDLNGNARPSVGNWDIGAIQSTGTTAPLLSFSPSPAAFGNQNTGTTGTKTITVSNVGTATETYSSIAISPSVFTNGNTGLSGQCAASGTIAVSTSCTVLAKFTPTAVTSYSGTLSVTGTVNGSDILTGAGTNAISIPSVPTGLTAAVSGSTINLSWNASTGTVVNYVVRRATVSGGPYTTIASPTTTTYADTSLSAGTYFYVVASSNSAGTSANSTQATGTVIALAPAVNISPANLVFLNPVSEGTTNKSPFTVMNSGTANLILFSSNAVTVSGANAADFAIDGATTCTNSLVVAPGANCTVMIAFTPTTTTTETATACVSSNSPDSPDCVVMTGTGMAPVIISPAALNFGNINKNKSSAAQVVTYSNNSGSTVTLGITITGTNASEFSKTTTCGGTQATATQCTVSVTFSPTSNGSKTANLVFTDTAFGSPRTVTLTGQATGRKVLRVGAVVGYKEKNDTNCCRKRTRI
jgi:hypothetical protein